MYVAKEQSCLEFCSTDLGYIFGGDMRNDLELLMRGKGSQKPWFAYNIVRIHLLIIYTDIYRTIHELSNP